MWRLTQIESGVASAVMIKASNKMRNAGAKYYNSQCFERFYKPPYMQEDNG